MMRSWKLRITVVLLGLGVQLVNCDQALADYAFGMPRNLGPVVNRGLSEAEPSIAYDGLSIYYSQGTLGVNFSVYVATRPTQDADWGNPIKLGPQIQVPTYTGGQHIASDGLTLFYSPMRTDGYGGPGDLWVTTRSTEDDPWGIPVILGEPVNSGSEEWAPSLSGDNLSLCFMSTRPGGRGQMDLWMTTRPTLTEDWPGPINLGPIVNSSDFEGHPSLSADGRTLFFQSRRTGGLGGYDIWMTTRRKENDAWTAPRNLGPAVNSPHIDGEPSISSDGSTLYFSSDRPGGHGNSDLWEVRIRPVVDFSGNGTVDTEDLLQLIQSWGQDDPLVDIGPTPFGDGVVDAADLEIIMNYWGQEVDDPTLKACWKLDEIEGDIAYDSAGQNDASVHGSPVWQPESGQVNGALQFDGTDDCLSTDFVLNPADTAFSVFAWIKGGSANQAIISQKGDTSWLLTDAQGFLMTQLTSGGRRSDPLYSDTLITDDNWHRIGFTWDGAKRILYVDNGEVASDTQPALKDTKGDLRIGVGKNLEPGTFWSGMIDDIRIYDRVVTP